MKATYSNPLARLASNKPTEPPPPLEFSIAHPSGLTAMDIDVLKLTAQFTAVNGRDFLAGIAQREQRNPQFDFLKPTHLLFSYFTSLVDAYTKVLAAAASAGNSFASESTLISRVSLFAGINETASNKILESAVHRWEWTKIEAERKRRNEIERLFRRLKGFRRIFSRFEKLDVMFIGFINFALIVEALRLC
jgi:splicing factor 3A subunit 1